LPNFAITGVGGYIAPRHLRAIRDVGGRLLAAVDPHDAVGVLDQHFQDCRYFREFERFDRFVERRQHGSESESVHYVSICCPNYLHDAHVRFALRAGAEAICEKPLVLSPWNLDALERMEDETGGRVSAILQLRLHPPRRRAAEGEAPTKSSSPT
jgi:UDP-N-acetyl-2-amino-2-deoxyglucuronate dehydrogenase